MVTKKIKKARGSQLVCTCGHLQSAHDSGVCSVKLKRGQPWCGCLGFTLASRLKQSASAAEEARRDAENEADEQRAQNEGMPSKRARGGARPRRAKSTGKVELSDAQAQKLATISYNRHFSPRDAREYGLTLDLRRLLRCGYIAHAERGQYYLTREGELAVSATLSFG